MLKKAPQREFVGEASRRLREQAGLTREQVAERVAGIESPSITRAWLGPLEL